MAGTIVGQYQYLEAEKIPEIEEPGRQVIVISGDYQGTKGPAQKHVPSTYLDVRLDKAVAFTRDLEDSHNSLIFIHSGKIFLEGQKIGQGNMVEFIPGASVKLVASEAGAGFLFLSGRPNNEPFYRGGPFIMNTPEEIEQAFLDYQNGKLF